MKSSWTWEQTLAALHSSDVGLAVDAIEQLVQLADESRVPELYQLMHDPSFFVREAAAIPLTEIEGAQSLKAMFAALEQGRLDGFDNDGLTNTVTSLLEAKAEACHPILQAMLTSPISLDRQYAAWAWGYINRVAPAAPLIDLLNHELDPGVKADAIGSLSSYRGDERVFQVLIAGAQDQNQEICLSAISALGYYGDQRAEPVLKLALKNDNPLIQQGAKYAHKVLKSKLR